MNRDEHLPKHTRKEVGVFSPLALQYLALLDPAIVTPRIFKEGGATDILVWEPGQDAPLVCIVRFIGKMIDGGWSIQDEISINQANLRTQMNFELNAQKDPVSYPSLENISAVMQEAFTALASLSTQRGARMRSGNGFYAESDGTAWIPKKEPARPPTQKTLGGRPLPEPKE